MNQRISGWLLLVTMLGWQVGLAQLPAYYDYLALYEEAVELFEKDQYGAALRKAEEFLEAEDGLRAGDPANDLHAHARFIQAVSALRLDRTSAVRLLDEYVRDYRAHTRAPLALSYLGDYYFSRRDYRDAIEAYQKAYEAMEPGAPQFYQTAYRLGYAYYQSGQPDEALAIFDRLAVMSQDNPYQEDARYYVAVLLYDQKRFEEALVALQRLQDSEKYGRETRIYLANTLLKLRRFDDLYVLAEELISGPRIREDEAQIYYVVANASFERDDYPRTTEYFKLFEQNRGKLGRTDYFRYGYAHYQMQQYREAIPIFQRALGRQAYDSLTQVASYYLGFCYLKTDQESESRIAFKKAAEGERLGNPEIAKDALYQYGKVSFSTENYSDALDAFTELTQKYPRASFNDEVQGLIGETYLNTRNYAKAIAYFESVPRNSNRARKAYQIVCYFYGIELYERGDYRQAEGYFRKAEQNDFDTDLSLSAEYWLGEALFRQEQYDASGQAFKSFLNAPGVRDNEFFVRGYYGLAWARFKQKKYSQAFTNFDTYITKADNSEPTKLRADAYLRAGDCQFLLKNYPKAGEYYSRVIRFNAYGDYAAYQLAEGYYRQGDYNRSVETFDKMISSFPQSEFRDDALDRISEIYVEWLKNYNQTLKYGRMLVNEYPRSPLAARTYNRMARAAFELGQQDQAISYLKKIVTDYGNFRDQAQLALDNLSGLLPEREFDRLLRDYRNQNPDMNQNLASLVFNTGKDRFFSGNYSSAISQFSEYINDYRNGPDYFEVLVFRARSYRELGQLPQALEDYRQVYASNANTPWATVALQEAGEIEFDMGNYTQSLSLYQQLETLATKLPNRVIAWFGVAKNLKALERYAEAQDVLLNVADNTEAEVYDRTEALVEIGRCQFLRGDYDGALRTFTTVENDFKNAFGAESQAMKARVMLEQGIRLKQNGQVAQAEKKFNAVKEATRYMANNYPTFNYWKARTFLVLAESYYQLGNSFQAKGTLESLIKLDDFPDIQQEAMNRLAEIEAEEGR